MDFVVCHMCGEEVSWAALEAHAISANHVIAFEAWVCLTCKATHGSFGDLGRHLAAERAHVPELVARVDHGVALVAFLRDQLRGPVAQPSAFPSAFSSAFSSSPSTLSDFAIPNEASESEVGGAMAAIFSRGGGQPTIVGDKTIVECGVCHLQVTVGRNGTKEMTAMKTHVLKTHEAFYQSYECPFCRKRFTGRGGASGHIKAMHRSKKVPFASKEVVEAVWDDIERSFGLESDGPGASFELAQRKRRFIASF